MNWYKVHKELRKMVNGKQKKSRFRCCLEKKKNKTIEDKQKIILYKVHKQLHKHFRPQRKREYAKEYAKNHTIHKKCPAFGRPRRSCSHCMRPHKYPILCKTMDNKKLLNCEINSYFKK